MTDDIGGSDTILSRGGGDPVATAGVPTGTVIAGYTVESLAGVGGMGVVYRALDAELGRTVALKLIAPERAGDTRLRELFVRESLTAAGLEHPNVIPIYRAGDDDGQLFIAMRFVEGASLQDLIAEAPEGIPPGARGPHRGARRRRARRRPRPRPRAPGREAGEHPHRRPGRRRARLSERLRADRPRLGPDARRRRLGRHARLPRPGADPRRAPRRPHRRLRPRVRAVPRPHGPAAVPHRR